MRNKPEVSTKKLLNIGQIAKLAGVGVETIRFYEREGGIAQAKRKTSGYRQFDVDTVQQIRFIRRVQDVGFSLHEAGDLASSKGLLGAIKQIDRRIHDLKELQQELRRQLRTHSK